MLRCVCGSISPSTRPISVACCIPLLALVITSKALAQVDAEVRNEVRTLVASATLSELRWPSFPDYREWLDRLYGPADYAPQWLENGRPRPVVAVAIAELQAATDRGLSPQDYDVDWLERETKALEDGDTSAQRVAHIDVALTVSVLRYISDLHIGRIHPRYGEFHYEIEDKRYDLAELLQNALAQNQLGPVIDAAEPSFPIYLRLKELLARYRTLALQPPVALPPFPPKVTKIRPGEPYSGSVLLRERLEMLGDLPGDAPPATDEFYSSALVEAVKRFQARHGLNPDGVLGRETLAQLNVPTAQRVRQIELSLERLRWLPDLPRAPVIAVNVPSYRLLAFGDLPSSDRPALTMPVIVGRAGRTQTPIFIGDMRYVEFSPYWNVPPNIQQKEIVPKLARDPAYLEREDMELVSTSKAGQVTTTINATTLAALRSGKLRVRQRPGGKNALGGIKFVLPNTMDIYLHGTPAQQLFERTRRDFSHGCIRVADPVTLAQFVLRDQPDWTTERILAAMSAGKTSTVKLTQPVPVVIFYTTVIVENDGRALFLPDVYHYDENLDKVLRAGYPHPA